MKKYDMVVDIKSTRNELMRAIRWRELCNTSKEKLAAIIDTQINNHCEEIIGQYHLVMNDHEKGLLSDTKFTNCIKEIKLLFKDYRYYKHYTQSLMDIRDKIEKRIAA